MISTRGRYAIRVLIDLAEHNREHYIPMKDVANRQDISLKYLERILPVLVKNDIVEGQHGKGGGYRLKTSPDNITVGQILRLTEIDIAPVECLQTGAKPCERASVCRTLSMWKEYHRMTNEYFDGITILDLVQNQDATNYVI